jgi:hypothetical protein
VKTSKIAKKFSPAALGIFDEVTDIWYYFQSDFANKSL